jgi:hypothetical protein
MSGLHFGAKMFRIGREPLGAFSTTNAPDKLRNGHLSEDKNFCRTCPKWSNLRALAGDMKSASLNCWAKWTAGILWRAARATGQAATLRDDAFKA